MTGFVRWGASVECTTAIGLCLLVVGVVWTPVATASGAPTLGAPGRAGLATSLTYAGNLYLNDTGPNATITPGEKLMVVYSTELAGGSAGAPVEVRVPAAVAIFQTLGGPIRLYLLPAYLNASGGRVATQSAQPSDRLATGTTFDGNSSSTVSTSGFALMASLPAGGSPISFRWQWVLVQPDGNESAGPWSPWATVYPAALALLSGDPSPEFPLGGKYPVCLNGDLVGRTFAGRLTLKSPAEELTISSVTVPAGSASVYCWNSTMPVSVPAQVAVLHIWEFTNGSSYLLYQITLNLVNPTPAASPSNGGLGWVPWAVAGIVAVGVAIGLLRARAHRKRGAGLGGSAPPAPPP